MGLSLALPGGVTAEEVPRLPGLSLSLNQLDSKPSPTLRFKLV